MITMAVFVLMYAAGPSFTGPSVDSGNWENIFQSAGLNPNEALNVLSRAEADLGWELLFDEGEG